MLEALMSKLRVVLRIAKKDIQLYFLKGPNLTFGIFLPLVLYWSFATDRIIEPSLIAPGLVAMAILFGAGAIQGVALPLERRTGTLHMLLTAPLTPSMLIFAKALAGTFFGFALSLVYAGVLLILTPVALAPVPFFVSSLSCSFCFSCFGLLLAVPFRDIPQAMPPATVVRIAMVFLAGTFSSIEGRPIVARVVARLLPLTYGVNALRQAVNGLGDIGAFFGDVGALGLFSILFLWAATRLFERSNA